MTPSDFNVVIAQGVQVTTGAASAAQAIPNDASGQRAKFVRVSSKATAYVQPGASTVTATTASILISASEALYLNVLGMTHIAHIQETAATIVNITPLEVG
jgi:hypothetical protein